MKILPVGNVALVACLWPGFGFAQNISTTGRVSDPLGGTINGALVTVNSSAEPNPKTTRTGVDGTFSFDDVPAGSITVQVEAPGFERWTQTVTLRQRRP